MLKDVEIAISMDGRGASRDNIFVERLWRTIRHEEIYLRADDTVGQARTAIGQYLNFYNGQRPHSSLDRKTPYQAYFDPQQTEKLAAGRPPRTTYKSAQSCSNKRSHLTN